MKQTVIYHIKSLPEEMALEEVLEVYHATGVLVYDKHRSYIIDSDNLDHDMVILKYSEWLTLN